MGDPRRSDMLLWLGVQDDPLPNSEVHKRVHQSYVIEVYGGAHTHERIN